MSSGADGSTSYLFILMGALGDVVRGMYLVDALKTAQPHSRITWLVEPASAGILKLHPRIDEIVIFDRPKGVRGVLALRKELKKRSFDVTLDLQRHSKSGLFSWFSGAPRRIGFHRKDAKEGNWIFNTEYVEAHGEGLSKVEHYQRFLAKLGIELPTTISSGLDGVRLENVTSEWASELVGEYVACILGSSWDSKDWPEEGYAGLLRLLAGRTVVLLSDKSKVAMAERLEKIASGVRIVNLAGRTTLAELVAVIRGARVCVGPDSGPGHIAGAVGTPHVTLFGPTPALRNTPRGSEALALSSQVGCSPCKRRVCPGLGKICMKLITPESVYGHVARFLG
jgi:ADP-heptose:LPS heptosyltransferase